MEGLDYLCMCCKQINCNKDELIIIEENGCKTIKCLKFDKDETRITPYEKEK